MEKIYFLDNASTTKVFDELFGIAKENNENYFYNPSSSYDAGIKVKSKLNESREVINKALGGANGKLYFTSSATESNNTVFAGVHLRAGDAVLISASEHPSVYNSAHALEKRGIKVIDIPLNENGKVNEEKYLSLLKSERVSLVSIIHVSNETGVINDIAKLSRLAKEINPKIIFHSDGVQAFGKIKFSVRELGVDLYTISAHKLYSPRGIACLWVKNGVNIDPLLYGGGQESGLRSSTENVDGAVMFVSAVKKVFSEFETNFNKISALKAEFLRKLSSSKISELYKLNSDETASPYILSLSFDKIKGEVLMNALSADGVLISTGSACSSKKAGNRTLEAMGLSASKVVGSVRVSFSPYANLDLDYVVSCFEKNVLKLNTNVKR